MNKNLDKWLIGDIGTGPYTCDTCDMTLSLSHQDSENSNSGLWIRKGKSSLKTSKSLTDKDFFEIIL